jgi:uncharacterized protein YjbK
MKDEKLSVEKRILEKKNMVCITRFNQLKNVILSRSGNFCAGNIFLDVCIFDMKTYKQILTIFNSNKENIRHFCFFV